MGAKERLDKLIEVQNKGYDGILKYIDFCEEDKKNEPKQPISILEKMEKKPLTQEEVYWKMVDRRLKKNGIRL